VTTTNFRDHHLITAMSPSHHQHPNHNRHLTVTPPTPVTNFTTTSTQPPPYRHTTNTQINVAGVSSDRSFVAPKTSTATTQITLQTTTTT
jgi:hypothetical protein